VGKDILNEGGERRVDLGKGRRVGEVVRRRVGCTWDDLRKGRGRKRWGR
jgi:hypothetical protein